MDRKDREAILYAFAIEPRHDRETVQRYLSEHPEMAEEFADIVSSRQMGESEIATSVGWIPDPQAEEAWEQYRLCKPTAASAGQIVNPFSGVQGRAFVTLAEKLNIPRSILMALRDGLVEAKSIPDSFLKRLSASIGSSLDSLRAYFASLQPSPAGRAFKSDEKPSLQGQLSFRELIQQTDMSSEQREQLLEECANHGRDRSQPSEG